MILVDDRTGSAEVAPHISHPTHVTRLQFADFSFIGHGPNGPAIIGIERKTIMDLISSMCSGRLSGHQLIGLRAEYDWVYLIVEGLWRPDRHSGILFRMNRKHRWVEARLGQRRFMARDVYNYLNTLRVICGVHVIRVDNIFETARVVDSLYGWWSKPWERHTSHMQFTTPPEYVTLAKPPLVVRMVREVEGIGWDKARAVGKRYNTMAELCEASVPDLMEVPGVGIKMAENIWNGIRGKG